MEHFTMAEAPSIVSPVPSYRSNASENDHYPVWAREVAASLQNRQGVSAASSIISTRTKISTNTAREDARSIDLNIDGVYFRINRDGSRITTRDFRDTLPPYIPRLEFSSVISDSHGDQHSRYERDDRSVTTAVADRTSEPHRGFLSPREQPISYPFSTDHFLDDQTGRERAVTVNTLSRNPSFTPGKDTLSVVRRRTVSQNDVASLNTIPRKPVDPNARLRRRNGIRLPTLVTDWTNDMHPRNIEDQHSAADSASPSRRYPRSANPVLGNDNHSYIQRPPSPMFIGRNAPGLFPSMPSMPLSSRPPLSDDQATVIARSPATFEEGYAETYPPPPMESENDISVHYTRLIRSIDRDHRKALHERDKEMSKLRERLHEQDTVFRQQLRGRDFIIDDLKSRIAHLESTTEATVEKARNSVEDLWESRWKDRDSHLMERMRLVEQASQIAVDRAVAERDKTWAEVWATRQRYLIQQLNGAEQLPQHDLEGLNASPPPIF